MIKKRPVKTKGPLFQAALKVRPAEEEHLT